MIMNMDETKPQLTIYIEGNLPTDEAEEIEDDIAEYLGNRDHKGRVEDTVTGNTTTFEPQNLSGDGVDEQLLSVVDAEAKAQGR